MQKEPKSKILLIFIILIIFICSYVVVIKYNENKIDVLKKANDELLNQNKVLDSLNGTYMVEIKKKDSAIGNLVNQDNLLKNKVLSIDSKIKAINYEKANSHSDNFGSEQLRRYFADSLR
jgi:peptidoglycan hydrolase CwlO-like protein